MKEAAVLRREELEHCNACGFCQVACPVYHVTRHEGSSARGHNSHLKALLEEKLEPDHRLVSHFAECLTCRACTANCPTAMETDRVVVEGRSRLTAGRRSRLEGFVLRSLMVNPARFRRWMRLLRLGKKPPANAMLGLLRHMAILPQGLERASHMLPRPEGGFLHERIGKLGPSPTSGQIVTYFMSCGMNYLVPGAGEASLRVLGSLGCAVKIVDNLCCGLPAYVTGDLEAARQMARQNLAVFSEHPGPIISDCASCSSFLKEYPRLLGEEAADFAGRVRDFTEFTAQKIPTQSSFAVNAASPRVVTYHDPCHLSRYQKLKAEPRELLKQIEGLEYRELPEADWCCGGAGTYSIRHPRLSLHILERKMKNIRSTEADILATACPGCLLQLEYGVWRWRLPVRVVHVSQLLAETSLGRNRE